MSSDMSSIRLLIQLSDSGISSTSSTALSFTIILTIFRQHGKTKLSAIVLLSFSDNFCNGVALLYNKNLLYNSIALRSVLSNVKKFLSL